MIPSMVPETEKALLALMLDRDCRVKARGSVDPQWVTDPFLRSCLIAAYDWDKTHDTELTFAGWATMVGDYQRLAELADTCFAPRNLEAYAEVLRENWERLQAAEVVARASIALGRGSGAREVSEILSQGILGSRGGSKSIPALEAILETREGSVVPTGFPRLDAMLEILPGDFVCIAARPSMGKTSFAVDIARHLCLGANPVGFVSLEMRPSSIARKMAGVGSPNALRHLWLSSPKPPTLAQIEAVSHDWAASGVKAIVIDYLGLIAPPQGTRGSRYEVVTELSHGVKHLAREVDLPILCLAQLSRSSTHRPDRRPDLADLRDSGAIEEDADAVIFLHRPAYYDPAKDVREAWALLAKNRNGPTGDIRIDWHPEVSSFLNHDPLGI